MSTVITGGACKTNAEIICVGTELLLGQIPNSNAQYLSQRLRQLGVNLYYQTVVGDNPRRLEQVFRHALERSGLVLVTGGLGPTMDDITKDALASATGRGMVFDESIWSGIQDYFVNADRPASPNNKRQAFVIEGSTPILNPYGTAPGLVLEHGQTIFCLMPGPPRELKPMFEERIIPYLYHRGLAGREVIHSRTVRICGIGESSVETMVQHIVAESTNPTVATYASLGEVQLRVTCKSTSSEDARERVDEVVGRLVDILGDNVFGFDDDTLEAAAGARLEKLGWTLSLAESCTGGLLGHRITGVPGCSSYFLGGVVAYANEAKMKLLGVSQATLAAYGAVSEQTALEMAHGARRVFKADVGVSITGVAGPGGGSAEKPVGTVYVAVVTPESESAKRLLARPPRADIKWRSCQQALTDLWLNLGKVLEEH